jgi:hypothetical protein
VAYRADRPCSRAVSAIAGAMRFIIVRAREGGTLESYDINNPFGIIADTVESIL